MNEAIITFVTEEHNVGADYNVALPEFLTVVKAYRIVFENADDFYDMIGNLKHGRHPANVEEMHSHVPGAIQH